MSVTLTVTNETGGAATLSFKAPGAKAAQTHVLAVGAKGSWSLARGTMVSADAKGENVLPPTPVLVTQALTLTMTSGDAPPTNYGCGQSRTVAIAAAAATVLLGVGAYMQQQHEKQKQGNGMSQAECERKFDKTFCAKYEAGKKSNAPSLIGNAYGRAAVGMAIVTAAYWMYTQSGYLSGTSCRACQIKGGQWTGTSLLCSHLDICKCHT